MLAEDGFVVLVRRELESEIVGDTKNLVGENTSGPMATHDVSLYGIVAYCVLLIALTARSLLHPSDAAVAPSSPSTACRFSWKQRKCSEGCKLKSVLPLKCELAAPPPKTPAAVPAAAGVPASRGDELLRKRTVDSCLAAADIFEAASEREAEASEARATLQYKAADALNCAMRLRGHGNILLLEGTLDTPENKRFWGAHGARALRLAKAAKGHAALAKLPSAAAAEMDAFMYQGSAKGIVQTALTGDGFEFKRLAEALIADHELHDGASSHCYLGGFYNVAPWPLKDQKKALVEMRAAAALEPRSRRNQYYVCVVELQLGNAAAAADACERARAARCLGTEEDYCAFMDAQIEGALAKAKA